MNDLVRPREHRWWDDETQSLRRLEVDDELELARLLDGKVGRLGALENPVHVGRGAPKHLRDVGAITEESTRVRELPPGRDGGEACSGRQIADVPLVLVQGRGSEDQHR